jgi:hypothetical protein
MSTMKIAGLDLVIRPAPASKTARIMDHHRVRETRLSACAAAIGLVWPDDDARTWGAPGDRIIDYGDAVIDDLMGRGVDIETIFVVGSAVIHASTGGLNLTAKAVKSAADFTQAPDRASTSGASSRRNGDSTRSSSTRSTKRG